MEGHCIIIKSAATWFALLICGYWLWLALLMLKNKSTNLEELEMKNKSSNLEELEIKTPE